MASKADQVLAALTAIRAGDRVRIAGSISSGPATGVVVRASHMQHLEYELDSWLLVHIEDDGHGGGNYWRHVSELTRDL